MEKKKIYLTYDQQIEKLKSDGLIVCDEKRAKRRLKWEGYFNFAVGYNRLFKDENRRYEAGTTFEDVEALFDFDKKLRGLVYEYAQNIELNLKALISDEFSKNYGVREQEYLSEKNFTDEPENSAKVRWIVGTCRATLQDACRDGSGSYRDYIAYYRKRYGHVPFWALIRALSFGNLSKFLCLMKKEDGRRIAKEYGVSYSFLCDLVEVVVGFRNLAAHGERVYCARLSTAAIEDAATARKVGLPKLESGETACGKRDFMAFLIAAKYLLPHKEFKECLERLKKEVDVLEAGLNAGAFAKVMRATGLAGKWRELGELFL
ncbi:MAG: Abi family protein [Clostridia bacterium]|nr:Abi family protein [Clostridia bacterium]